MAKYLVTGACGFIGSHLCDGLIAAGHDVFALDNLFTGNKTNLNPNVCYIHGDVQDEQLLHQSMQGMDGVFHLAAIAAVELSKQQWVHCHEVNLTATIKVFNAAKTANADPIPVIYASSSAVYGDNGDLPLSEIAVCKPISAYGADKLACEQQARIATLIHGVPTIGLRFFNVYGPRQDPSSPYSGVISLFMDQVVKKQNVTIFGNGEQSRDFIYVLDVVNYLITAMEKVGNLPEVFNVCTGKQTTIKEVLDTIIAITESKPKDILFAEPRCGDIYHSYGHTKRVQQRLAVIAETDLKQGLALLFDSLQ